ncbi:hypothetical protein ABTM97_19490, partial [Acinetobacter baumannii]
MASALQWLGVERAFVVSAKGMDEVSPLSPTQVLEVLPNEIRSHTWKPADFGLPQLAIESVMAGTDLLENANLLRQAVSEVDS